jgi:hypothetical protein
VHTSQVFVENIKYSINDSAIGICLSKFVERQRRKIWHPLQQSLSPTYQESERVGGESCWRLYAFQVQGADPTIR